MNGSAVKSLERAIRILECFRDEQRALSAREVADSLNLPPSSAFVLLRSLVQIGYLHVDATTKEYFPTLLVTELGSWIPTTGYGLHQPRMLIEEIRDATGETATLSVQNNLAMQILDSAVGTQMIVLNVRAGDRLPLFTSTIGKVALSRRPDAEIAKLISRANGLARNREQLDPEPLQEEIRSIRRTGYGIGHDAVIEGLGAIAWPIKTPHPASTLVVALAGPTPRIRANEAASIKKVRSILRRHEIVG